MKRKEVPELRGKKQICGLYINWNVLGYSVRSQDFTYKRNVSETRVGMHGT